MINFGSYARRATAVTAMLAVTAACLVAGFRVPASFVLGPTIAYLIVLICATAWHDISHRRSSLRVRARVTARGFRAPAQLPPQPLFVGRRESLDRVLATLEEQRTALRDRPRIVLVTGPPGIGKTAFAVRLAHALTGEHPGGSLFARLDNPLRQERTATYTRSFVTALEHAHGRAVNSNGSLRALTQGLRVLILVDDVHDASELDALLELSAGCTVIATSRTIRQYPAASLTVPLGQFTVDEAVDLLMLQLGDGGVERVAEAGGAAAELVQAAGLCPLAVRMAAVGLANAPYWSLSSAVERLRQLQRSELIVPIDGLDVSYALLAEEERRAIDVIGALDGVQVLAPWMLSAVLAASGLSGDHAMTARILGALVRARFLEQFSTDTAGVPLFRMHDQIVIYAARRAERRGGEFVAACRRALADAQRSRRDVWFEGRAAHDGLEAMNLGEFETALRLALDAVLMGRENGDRSAEATGLTVLAEIHTELGATRHAEELIGAARAAADERCSAYMLRCTGKIDRRLRLLDRAELSLRRALALAAEAGDKREVVHCERELTVVLAESGRTREGLEAAQRAAQVARSLGADGLVLIPGALWAQARALVRAGDARAALKTLDEADALARESRRELWRAWISYEKGTALLQSGDPQEALSAARHASRLFDQMRHEYGAAYCHVLLGACIRKNANELTQAARVLESAFNTFQRCGDPWIEAETARLLAEVRGALGQRSEAALLYHHAAGSFEELGDQVRSAAVRAEHARLSAHRARDLAADQWIGR